MLPLFRDHPRLAGAATVDYRRLPRAFHRYFTAELQPLERESVAAP